MNKQAFIMTFLYKVFENSTAKLISLNRADEKFEKQRNMSSLELMYDENNEQVLVWDSGTAMVYFKKKIKVCSLF